MVVKPYSIDMELTYPPSMVFFDEHAMWIRASVQGFIDAKKTSLRPRVRETVLKALKNVRIGDFEAEVTSDTEVIADARGFILHEIREKLLGKTVKATGSIEQVNERLYFFPRTVNGVS
mgnify:FL=1